MWSESKLAGMPSGCSVIIHATNSGHISGLVTYVIAADALMTYPGIPSVLMANECFLPIVLLLFGDGGFDGPSGGLGVLGECGDDADQGQPGGGGQAPQVRVRAHGQVEEHGLVCLGVVRHRRPRFSTLPRCNLARQSRPGSPWWPARSPPGHRRL